MPLSAFAPSPEWLAARHRLRNDLQTLASLMRLGAHRCAPEALIAAFPDWLAAMAAVYDLLPSSAGDSTVSLRALVTALNEQRGYGAGIPAEGRGDAPLPAAVVLAVALGLDGLLAFSRNAAGPSGDVRIEITGGIRPSVRAAFVSAAEPAGWPPLGVDLAADALDGEAGHDRGAELMTLSLEFPCP